MGKGPLVVFGALCCFFTVVYGAVIMPDLDGEDYNLFFQTLSSDEKEWIMHLAVLYYDADYSQVALPVQPIPVVRPLVHFYPVVPLTNMTDFVPERLIAQFLNGEVPKNFQKRFTSWLAKQFKLKKHNFEQYRKIGVFCTNADSCDLVNLHNIGGQCCPFG